MSSLIILLCIVPFVVMLAVALIGGRMLENRPCSQVIIAPADGEDPSVRCARCGEMCDPWDGTCSYDDEHEDFTCSECVAKEGTSE